MTTATKTMTKTNQTIFSNADFTKYELISEEILSEDKKRYRYRYGSLNICLTSNAPSEHAIKRAANIVNEIAISQVDKETENNEDVGQSA